MTIIADSGSTKTSWMEVESGNRAVTPGLNPHFTSDEEFLASFDMVGRQLVGSQSHPSVFFYGAGCGSGVQRERVTALLRQAFETDRVTVETDMLGACRAVCAGGEPALVGILGTGSNACYYDGNEIQRCAVSTGYILGDEGSANHVGRRMLQDYLTGKMPAAMASLFREEHPLTRDQFLDAVYHHPNANRFLASLAQFAVKNINNDYCATVILTSLELWYRYQLGPLQEETCCGVLSLVGGFAAHIKPLVAIVAKKYNLELNRVVADPIEGLRDYYIRKF